MSGISWLYAVWLVIDLVMFFVGCLMIVIGGTGRERESRTMHGEAVRQETGAAQRRRARRARAHEQVLLENDMADIRAERADR